MCLRATVVSHPPSLLSSGNLSMLCTRMVNVSWVMSAASSFESPYFLGTEKTSLSYFFSRRLQVSTRPSRQPLIRSRSEAPASSFSTGKLIETSRFAAGYEFVRGTQCLPSTCMRLA